MDYIKKTIFFILLFGNNCLISAQLNHNSQNSTEVNLYTLLIPAIIALVGYFGKSFYEIYTNNQKRKRELIEAQLHLFYWPIVIRLKKNENTYHYLFKGKREQNEKSISSIIARYVEVKVLMKNHVEILEIITEYRYLSDSDDKFEQLLNSFIRHVTIYQAFIEADIKDYPGVSGDAPYPTGLDKYFYDKTEKLQTKHEKLKF